MYYAIGWIMNDAVCRNGSSPSNAFIIKTQLFDCRGFKKVTAVKYHFIPQCGHYLEEVGSTELVPLGSNDERIGAITGGDHVLGWLEAVMPGRIGGDLWVEGSQLAAFEAANEG